MNYGKKEGKKSIDEFFMNGSDWFIEMSFED